MVMSPVHFFFACLCNIMSTTSPVQPVTMGIKYCPWPFQRGGCFEGVNDTLCDTWDDIDILLT